MTAVCRDVVMTASTPNSVILCEGTPYTVDNFYSNLTFNDIYKNLLHQSELFGASSNIWLNRPGHLEIGMSVSTELEVLLI